MTDDSPEPENKYAKALADIPTEELRLALVLNGGVSLAVWMGGVAHEIDRMTRSTPGTVSTAAPYGPILEAARSTASVDIISGTSAGGINGAALALAQANEKASLLDLRTLWSEQGRMEALLRRPFQGKPTSLLRGDDYFLPELHKAMRTLSDPFKPRADKGSFTPISLILTTTLLKGSQKITVDDFGQRIPQRVHNGEFLFSNILEGGVKPKDHEDPFARANIDATAKALALAARCTASFPFAFEPSFVPVMEEFTEAGGRVNMKSFASWAHGDSDQSRYVMDGGVLANTPLTPTLEAIDKRQADGPVRRALLLVFPHAPAEVTIEADKAKEPPGVGGAAGGFFGALMSQGSRSFVENVDEHNRRAGEWRGSRDQVLAGLGQGDGVRSLYEMLERAWPHYRHIRIRIAARGLAGKVKLQEQWSYDRVRQAAEDAQQEWAAQRVLPYVPAAFDWKSPEWQRDVLTGQSGWQWGDSPAVGIAEAAAAVFRAALGVAPAALKDDLAKAREEIGLRIGQIHRARRGLDEIWLSNPFLVRLPPDRDYWRSRIVAYGSAMIPRPEAEVADELEQLLPGKSTPRATAISRIANRDGFSGARVCVAISAILDQLIANRAALLEIARQPAGGDAISGVHRWCHYLLERPALDDEPADEKQRLLLRLLALDASTRLLSEGTQTGGNLPVRLAELSLRIEHPWAQFSKTPDDKAAGLEVSRFGGFLKRSWRMNDWTWGRLDAITMLCQLVLDPQRLNRLAAMVPSTGPADLSTESGETTTPVAHAIFKELERGLYGADPLPELLESSIGELRRAAEDELAAELQTASSDRRHLPALARWAALPLQAEVILEELPVIATAVELDAVDGAGASTRGTRFLAVHKNLLAAITTANSAGSTATTAIQRLELGFRALLAFDDAGIGREQISGETGSNALIRTASNAAGVAVTVVDTEASRFKPVKPVTSAIRGAALLPYWLVTGLASASATARFLATAGLVVGGMLLALSLFGVLGAFGSTAGLAGAAALLAAFAYSALKTGSLLHAAALIAPVGPLLALALDPGEEDDGGAARVIVIVVVVIALYALASLPWPLGSPLVWVKRHRGRTAVIALLAILAAVVGFAWSSIEDEVRQRYESWSSAVRDSELADWLQEDQHAAWAIAGVAVAVVVLGLVIAYVQGAFLRPWRPDGSEATSYRASGTSATGRFARLDLEDPAGVAGAWAPVYGAAYLVATGVFVSMAGDVRTGQQRAWETWEIATAWWLGVIGVVLCLVAPVLVARPSRKRVRRLMGRSWASIGDLPLARTDEEQPKPRNLTNEQKLIHALLKYDASLRYLVHSGESRANRWRPGTKKAAGSLVLASRGRALLKWLQNPED